LRIGPDVFGGSTTTEPDCDVDVVVVDWRSVADAHGWGLHPQPSSASAFELNETMLNNTKLTHNFFMMET
jgi:hypothetical protein